MHHIKSTAALLLLGFVPLWSAPNYPDKAKLLIWLDDDGKEPAVKNANDWAKRRAHILANLQDAMGELPDRASKPNLKIEYGEGYKGEGWVRKKLTFQVADGERVPGYLFLPTKQP